MARAPHSPPEASAAPRGRREGLGAGAAPRSSAVNRRVEPAERARRLSGAAQDEPTALEVTLPAAEQAGPRGPLIRLRTVLALALLVGLAFAAAPRVKASWKLHTLAPTYGNYALCMVGPTGPQLFRDASPEYRVLLRRRLLASGPTERPFERCASLARDLGAPVEVERAHRADAASFIEYQGAGTNAELSLERIRLSVKSLAALHAAAWPFTARGWVSLMQPTVGAYEAVHPVAPSRPRLGQGLPHWRTQYRSVRKLRGAWVAAFGAGANLSVHRSTDEGVTWRATPSSELDGTGLQERCSAGSSTNSFAFGMSDDGAHWVVSSLGPEAPPTVAPVGGADAHFLAAACDHRSLVVLLAPAGKPAPPPELALCVHHGGCAPMRFPSFGGARPLGTVDVARIDGTTILSVAAGKVVRVSSSRDDGKTWAPWSVAYDAGEPAAAAAATLPVPSRLLALDERVLLYAGAPNPAQRYPVLVSDDLGASWRTP